MNLANVDEESKYFKSVEYPNERVEVSIKRYVLFEGLLTLGDNLLDAFQNLDSIVRIVGEVVWGLNK